jgi:hypothetical protein
MFTPIEAACHAMNELTNHHSISDFNLSKTTYVAGILYSASNNVRAVLLSSAGENARGFTQALLDDVQKSFENNDPDVSTVVFGWVNSVQKLSAGADGARFAGNDAEQQLLRVHDFTHSARHGNESKDRLQMDEDLLSDRLSDVSYTSETGDDIPSLNYNRRTVVGGGESEWVSPILALKTNRVFCQSCTEVIKNEGFHINPNDQTEAER